MLHDPKWNHGTLDGLITWLEGKPRNETYSFARCESCLIAQYMGETVRETWPEEMRAIYGGRDEHRIARGGDNTVYGFEQTFGAALDRAYKAREKVCA